MPMPLYGFLAGDTIGLVIFAEEEETAEGLARLLMKAASVRVGPREGPARVVYKGRVIDPKLTIARAGIEPLERFDVVFGATGELREGR